MHVMHHERNTNFEKRNSNKKQKKSTDVSIYIHTCHYTYLHTYILKRDHLYIKTTKNKH